MEKENLNILSCKGVLGRKNYFLTSLSITLINVILQKICCKNVIKAISSFYIARIQNPDSAPANSLVAIFTSNVPVFELLSFIILFILVLYFAFNYNTKRFFDITGNKKMSFIIALVGVLSAIGLYLVNYYNFKLIISLILLVIGFIALFKKGKFVNQSEQNNEQ